MALLGEGLHIERGRNMSILENILNGLTGNDSDSSTDSDFTPPTTLCRSDCGIAGQACTICQPYKEKLINALYNVEHIEEYQAKYEVVGSTSVESGAVKCPYCGANSENIYTCEYCGSKLQEGTDKIKVSSAADIPDPIIEARDIIYDRHAAIAEKYGTSSDNDSLSSILSGIAGIFTGGSSQEDSSDSETSSLGTRMSRDEIEQMAAGYGVSVATYLKGLDNGMYKTMNQKKNSENNASKSSSGASIAGIAAAGLGTAGIGAGVASLIGNSKKNSGSNNNRPPMPPQGGQGGFGQQRGMGQNGNMNGNRGGMGGPGGNRGGMGGPGGRR